jgi:rubredoxin
MSSISATRMLDEVRELRKLWAAPIPMRLMCPTCGDLHVDQGEFATKPHHTHACQSCGQVWRPAIATTVGVRFLPGFRNHETPAAAPPAPPTNEKKLPAPAGSTKNGGLE